MAEIIDQIVKVSIQDAISSVTTVDVNTVAIVGRVSDTARVVEITPALASGQSGAEGSKKIETWANLLTPVTNTKRSMPSQVLMVE